MNHKPPRRRGPQFSLRSMWRLMRMSPTALIALRTGGPVLAPFRLSPTLSPIMVSDPEALVRVLARSLRGAGLLPEKMVIATKVLAEDLARQSSDAIARDQRRAHAEALRWHLVKWAIDAYYAP